MKLIDLPMLKININNMFGFVLFKHDSRMIIESHFRKSIDMYKISNAINELLYLVFYEDFSYLYCDPKYCPLKEDVVHLVIYNNPNREILNYKDIILRCQHTIFDIYKNTMKINISGDTSLAHLIIKHNEFLKDILEYENRIKSKTRNQLKAYIEYKGYKINSKFKLNKMIIREVMDAERNYILKKYKNSLKDKQKVFRF